MADYIEREAVLKIIGDNCPHDKCGYNTEEEMGAGVACYYIRKDVENIPTADVVPRSEVEKLKIELEAMRGAANSYKLHYEKAKQEVAREMIAEFKDLVLKYVQDRDLLLVAFKNAVNYAETELEKKYIGETE